MFVVILTNNDIKELKKLKDKKYRRELNLFLVEGDKFCRDLLDSDAEIVKTITTNQSLSNFPNIVLVSQQVFESLSSTPSPQTIICVCKVKFCNTIESIGNSLILYGLQDPGNVGTLVRSALSFGFNDVYLINCADVFSEKVIRSSVGSVLKVRLHNVNYQDLNLHKQEIAETFLSADMNGESIATINLPNSRIAVIIGNEGNGVSDECTKLADVVVKIPMTPYVESLNAGVAGSILMYKIGEEYVRS